MLYKHLIILLSLFALPLEAQIRIELDKALHVKEFSKNDIFLDVYSTAIDKNENISAEFIKPYLTKENKFLLHSLPSNLDVYDSEGKFLNKIHTEEQLPINTYDREKNYFYLETLGEYSTWYGIDLKIGEVVTALPKPSVYERQIANFKKIGDNSYACFVNNQSGKDSLFFIFFDTKGNVKGTIPEHRTYSKIGGDTPYLQGQFYDYKGKHYFKEPLWGTTVYEIGDCKLIPHIQFDLGNKTPDYAYRGIPEKNKDTYQLGTVMETSARVYFSYNTGNETYWGYYNKDEGKTYVTKLPSENKITNEGKNCNFLPAWESSSETVNAIQTKDEGLVIVVGELK